MRPRRHRRIPRPLALLGLLAGAFVVSAVLVEILVLLVAGPQVRFPRHVVEAPWGLRYNQPDATYTHRSRDGTWEFRINGQGMRADQEYAYHGHPDTLRVISLGDSFTVGYEVDVDETFSAVLERALREAGTPAQVLNAGVSGYSTAEAALYLERELLSYEPDVVVLSFYGNDLVDNVRTGLFNLGEDGRAVVAAERYVPAGSLGNWLNRSWLFNQLSARSNAFAFLKERLTLVIKRSMVRENQAQLAASDEDQEATARVRQELGAAIVRRMRDTLAAHDIPLVVQSIPVRVREPELELVDAFPYEFVGEGLPGLHFLPATRFLEPHLGQEPLYHDGSHFHWTPFAHRESGQALARLIMDVLAEATPAPPGPSP